MRLNYERLKKSWFHISLLICFIAAVALLAFLDYFNLEIFTSFNERGFYFDYTWKGRLFILFFVWLFILESFINVNLLEKDQKARSRSHFKVLAIFVCAIIPIIYIVSVNFLGLDQTVTNIGEVLRGGYWRAHSPWWELIFQGDWPLTVEYLVFTFSFLATILLAYGKDGLKAFSISLALIAGVGAVYMIDTLFPYGAVRPLQILALPTAACAAGVLEFMGYSFTLSYSPGLESMPLIRSFSNGSTTGVNIGWPCAGVHSFFLYTLIILLLFRKSSMSNFRKLMYFIIGAIGTYFVNILRIVTYFQILVGDVHMDAQIFHESIGELYPMVWILFYILLITCIQKFSLVERTANALREFLERVKSKVSLPFKSRLNENESI